MTHNPVVFTGPCVRCGGPVELHEHDARDIFDQAGDNPMRFTLEHITCPVSEDENGVVSSETDARSNPIKEP